MKTSNLFSTIAAVFLIGLAAFAQFAQFPGTPTTFLAGDNTWREPTAVSTLTVDDLVVDESLSFTVATLAPASLGTNYGLDVTASPAGLIAMTNHVHVTGLTNAAAGRSYRLLVLNSSGSTFNVTVASGYKSSTTAGVPDLPTTLTNNTAAILDVYCYGTGTTQAVYRFRRFLP